jgi:lysophospholipase L1-like esterase
VKFVAILMCLLTFDAVAAARAKSEAKWVAAWAGSSHGPYPAGNAVAQPDLQAILPAGVANDQTFRLIVKPGIWGGKARIRMSNMFGAQPVTFDGVYVGVHATGGSLLPGTNKPVLFRGGKPSVTVEPGDTVWSDPVDLKAGDWTARKLAVSFHVAGISSAMTWHAKAMQTSYLSRPKDGSHGSEDADDSFPFTTTSWFFLDAVEMMAPQATQVIVAFGDSITDGTNSTINGDDRWPDFLARKFHGVLVNAGIGGNQLMGPAVYEKAKPTSGGPSALDRLDRDILSLSGVNTVIWLEGINDLSATKASAEEVILGFRKGIARLHAKGIRVIGATITSALNSTPTAGTADVDARRRAINEFIRHGNAFDAVADFDAATLDPQTGALRADFKPGSSIGGPGDGLHPNRAGYQAMAAAVDLKSLLPR